MATPQVEVVFKSKWSEEGPLLHSREALNQEAGFAMRLIERWGLVAGKTDGEDSAGRSIIALMDPKEVVSRAFETASLAYEEARNRGLIIDLPSWEECRTLGRAERERN